MVRGCAETLQRLPLLANFTRNEAHFQKLRKSTQPCQPTCISTPASARISLPRTVVRVLPKPKSAVAAKGDKNLLLKIAHDQLVLLTLLCLPSAGGAGFLLFRREFYAAKPLFQQSTRYLSHLSFRNCLQQNSNCSQADR
jgi:hypothetical protein